VPIYEYVCSSCGLRVEVLQRRGDPPPEQCPADACEGDELVRALSAHNVGGASFGSDPVPAHCNTGGACSGCPGAGGGLPC